MSKVFSQFLDGQASVAYHILNIEGHLGKAYCKTVWHKYWIVSEAFAVGVAHCKYLAVNAALEEFRSTIFNEAYYGAEAGSAVGLTVEGGEELVYIVVERAVFASVTCRVYAWCTTKCLYLEACIIGKNTVG